jgi:tetrahydromethanopterin S-methyltransferase subunit B
MASEKIRNIIRSKVNSAISLARKQVEQYGRGKLDEIKKQLEDPRTLVDVLLVDINTSTCSPKGKDKFNKKIDVYKNKIDRLQNIIDKLLKTIEKTKSKLDALIEENGVLPKINNSATELRKITNPLQIVITTISALINTVGFIPPPATAPSGPLILAKDGMDMAKGKITEIDNLILSIPSMTQTYIDKIRNILDEIDIVTLEAESIQRKITELLAYLLYVKLKFESDCSALLEGSTGIWGNNGTEPGINDTGLDEHLTLEELIALSNELAQGILNDLISQGEDKVLEKKEELIDIIKEYKIPYSYKIVDPTIVLQNMTAYTPPVPPDGEDG